MSSLLPRIQNALSKRFRRVSKSLYQSVRWRTLARPKVLLVVGCQCSGTTLMTSLFDADRDCRVFNPYSALSSIGKGRIRLNPLPDVAAVLSRVPAPLVVAMPLVETQRVRTLLNYFPDSKALFMYRRYTDVASSDLRKFGSQNAIDNIRPIASGNAHDWRSAGATPAVRDQMARFFSESMNPNDAAALFWFARNQLYFDLKLAEHNATLLCRYEHLASDPAAVMRRIYEFVGLPCPDQSPTQEIHSESISKGENLEMLPEVRTLCEQLQARLDTHYELQSRLPVRAGPASDTCVPQLHSAVLQ